MDKGESGFGRDRWQDRLAAEALDDVGARAALYDRDGTKVVGTMVRLIAGKFPNCVAVWAQQRGSASYRESPLELLAEQFGDESFMDAVKTYDEERGTQFSSWWITKATYRLREDTRDVLRVMGRIELLGEASDVEVAAGASSGQRSLDEIIEETERAVLLHAILADLPEDERHAIELVDFKYAGTSNALQAAAEELGWSWEDVRNAHRRACRRIHTEWVRRYGSEPD